MEICVEGAVLENNGRKITNRLEVDTELRPFFQDTNFYVEYDRDVSHVPLALLNIPAVSSVIHFAWAIGCDVTVGELDQTYQNNLKLVRNIFSTGPVYDFLSSEGELNVVRAVKSQLERRNREALLFSGGLDSTASRIRRKPEQLIMIWGLDIPTAWTKLWDLVVKTYELLPLTFVKSNTLELYDLSRLYALGSDCPAGYYAGFAFSLITFGLCPPITVNNVDSVMMASTFPLRQYGDPNYPFQNYKPHYFTDGCLGWSNVRTTDVENEHNRPQKVEQIIKPHFEEHGPLPLRVCGYRPLLKAQDKLNCNICDKCGRMIATLANFDIDPNSCGFNVHEKTFQQIKNNLLFKRYDREKERYFWGELKAHLKDDIEKDFHGSRSFLEWLGRYEL